MSNGSILSLLEFHINGLTPHVQHNSQLSDPMNQYTIAIRAITSKTAKKKTEDDFKRLDDLEWEGGLYLNDEKHVVVPGFVIEGAMTEAGRHFRKGKDVRGSVTSFGDWPLIYQGPKDLEKLKADPNFRLKMSVKNPSTGSRVMRTRPVFKIWELRFQIHFRPDMIDPKSLVDIVKILGSNVGLSDDRTRMGGRFEVLAAEMNGKNLLH